jgi:hypothetical protein
MTIMATMAAATGSITRGCWLTNAATKKHSIADTFTIGLRRWMNVERSMYRKSGMGAGIDSVGRLFAVRGAEKLVHRQWGPAEAPAETGDLRRLEVCLRQQGIFGEQRR